MSVSVEWFADAGVCALIVLDRPDKRNAVDLAMLDDLQRILDEVGQRASRVVVLTGAGSAFCSGADLAGVELGQFTDTLAAVLVDLATLPCLTVAAIDGPALGAGMQLAAACDLRLASADSPIGVPAVKLGLAVDAWTVDRIGREAGWAVARSILLTGEPMRAETMTDGFVHRIADAGRVREEAVAWAVKLADLAPLSIRAHKLAIAECTGTVDESDDRIAKAMSPAERARLAAWASADAVEGREAFRERRRPRFTGQ